MRKIATCLLFVAMSLTLFAQCGGEKPVSPGKAAGEGARATESNQLFLVFLNRPANAPDYPKEKLDEIQQGHRANIHRLAKEGKMKMAGPFMNDTKLRGIFVIEAPSLDEVKALLATDPAIKAGRLEGDPHPWKPGLGEIHDIQKLPENPGMETFVAVIYHWGDKSALAPAEEKAAWEGHRQYQTGRFEAKVVELAGPFSDALAHREKGDLIGVIFAHGKKEDGEKLAADDPIVKAGIAQPEVHEWATAKGVLYH